MHRVGGVLLPVYCPIIKCRGNRSRKKVPAAPQHHDRENFPPGFGPLHRAPVGFRNHFAVLVLHLDGTAIKRANDDRHFRWLPAPQGCCPAPETIKQPSCRSAPRRREQSECKPILAQLAAEQSQFDQQRWQRQGSTARPGTGSVRQWRLPGWRWGWRW